jgi:hypothetical protein
LPHEFRLCRNDLDVAAFRTLSSNPAVSVRRLRRNQDSGLQPVQTTAAGTLRNLRTFVLGDDALHRQQHPVFGGLRDFAVDEINLAAILL